MTDSVNEPPPNNAGRRRVGTVNITPSWVGVLPLYLEAYQSGTPAGRAAALAELQRMATLADEYVKLAKG